MTRTNKALIGLIAALAIGAGAQVAVQTRDDHESDATARAVWLFQPKNGAEVRAKSKDIVLAQVVSVKRGPDIVTKQPNEPSGEDRIATSRISVKVLQPYKGAYKAGQTVTLFQTGASMDDPAPPKEGKGNTATSKAQHIQLEGDPAYKAGEQYVLMLEAGPAGTQRPVSPEGRYRVDKKTGVLTGVVKNPVTNEIAGKSLKSLEKTLQSR